MLKIRFLYLFLLLLSPALSFAQLEGIGTTGFSSLSMDTIPPHPKAQSYTIAKLESNAVDLAQAEITWKVDGITQKKGIGERSVKFKTKKIGVASRIEAIIALPGNSVINRELIVVPAEVDLLWESVTSVPSFYKGKALFSAQGSAKIVAIPHLPGRNDALVSQNKIFFKWTRDNEFIPEASGLGKNIFILNDSILSKKAEVKVEIHSQDSNLITAESISLTPENPMVLFYENHPIFGIMREKAMGGRLDLGGREITLSLAPYFFSLADIINNKVSVTWSMNDAVLTDQKDKGEITLRQTEKNKGISIVNAVVTNRNKNLQSGEATISIKLNQNISSELSPF